MEVCKVLVGFGCNIFCHPKKTAGNTFSDSPGQWWLGSIVMAFWTWSYHNRDCFPRVVKHRVKKWCHAVELGWVMCYCSKTKRRTQTKHLGRNPANQMRLVVFTIIYRVWWPSQVVGKGNSEPSTVPCLYLHRGSRRIRCCRVGMLRHRTMRPSWRPELGVGKDGMSGWRVDWLTGLTGWSFGSGWLRSISMEKCGKTGNFFALGIKNQNWRFREILWLPKNKWKIHKDPKRNFQVYNF